MVAALVLGGCLHESATLCDDGGVCPAGRRCGTAGNTQICVAPTCGNGRLDPDEACDDGGNVSGDGCPADCVAPCGDGIVDPGEECDDANTTDGDGCDRGCRTTACGNGVVAASEACDDGNAVDGDGCDRNCTATACGNGVVTGTEACDDGNATERDGCDLGCTLTCFPERPSLAISPGTMFLIAPGASLIVELAFTNHNPSPCAPITFTLTNSFLFEGMADKLLLDPQPFTTIASSLVPSGDTGYLTITATAAGGAPPGTRFDVDVFVDGGTLLEANTLSFTIAAAAVDTWPRSTSGSARVSRNLDLTATLAAGWRDL